MGFPDPNSRLAALAVVGALALAGCGGSNDGGDGEPTFVAGQYSYLDELFAQVNLGAYHCQAARQLTPNQRIVQIYFPKDPPSGEYRVDPAAEVINLPPSTAFSALNIVGPSGELPDVTTTTAVGGTVRLDSFSTSGANGHARIDFGSGDVVDENIDAVDCPFD